MSPVPIATSRCRFPPRSFDVSDERRKEFRPIMATTYVRNTARHFYVAHNVSNDRAKLRIALWTAQVLLALVFSMTGSMKLLMPADLLQAQSPLPIEVVRFIGICEV